MKSPSKSIGALFLVQIKSFLIPLLVTLFLWLTRAIDITLWQGVIAFLLLYMPWQSFLKWSKSDRSELPLFSLIAFMFWLYYALALFWGEARGSSFSLISNDISEESVSKTMLMVLVGVMSLGIGMKSRIGQILVPQENPDISLKSTQRIYFRFILIGGTLGGMYESVPYMFGAGGRQIITILLTVIPTAAFAVLFRSYLRGESSRFDKILIVLCACARLLIGLSSGWLGTMVIFLIVCIAIYIHERRRIPRWALVLVFGYILFLQPGKVDMRQRYWSEDVQESKVERISFWVNASIDKWGEAISDPSGERVKDLGYQSLSRTSLLAQTANVVQLTPSTVPYQYGKLYSYMLVTLIPRFIWPDKPSFNEANQFYQVAYGLTQKEELSSVSMAVGFLAEGYISFGWVGVILIMYLMGIFFNFFQKMFLSHTSGLLFSGIGVALLPQFLTIESQLAQYLGGITQEILLAILVFLPLVIRRRNHKQMISQVSIPQHNLLPPSADTWNAVR